MNKQYLIKKNKEYRKVYDAGISLANRYAVVFACLNPQKKQRFGFSVGKRIGKAVVRNRVRRRLKEACREQQHLFPDGYDYIIVARKGIEGLQYDLLKKNVENLALRIKKKISK